MLHYEAHKNLKDYTSGECNRIIIYNEAGDPVSFVIQIGDKQYVTSHIGNKDFNSLLSSFGLDKLVIKHEK